MTTLADDRDAIRDLYARYCVYLDTGAIAEWAALYDEDGEFVTVDDRIVGRAALEAYGAGLRPGSVHRMIVNHVIDVEGDAATCRASVFLVSGSAIVSVGRTTDELRRVQGTWRIAHRSFVADAA